MRRAEKIRLANEAAKAETVQDTRDSEAREAARREWGTVRKTAREAFLANGNWMEILNDYREREGFYTPSERADMCKAYSSELISHSLR